MKKYQVNFYYDVTGKAYVTAKNAEEAEKMVAEHLGEYGMEEWEYKKDYEEDDRNWGINNVEEIELVMDCDNCDEGGGG